MKLPLRLAVAAATVCGLLWLAAGRRGSSRPASIPDHPHSRRLATVRLDDSPRPRADQPSLDELQRSLLQVESDIKALVESKAAVADANAATLGQRMDTLSTKLDEFLSVVNTSLHDQSEPTVTFNKRPVLSTISGRDHNGSSDLVRRLALMDAKMDRLLQFTPTTPAPTRAVVPLIPRLVHQTWKTTDIPSGQQGAVSSWISMNPNYTHKLHTDEDMEALIQKHYPEIIPAWQRMRPVEKADTFRYAILHKEGGFYADLDVTCSRPIDEWLPHVGHDPETTEMIVGFEVVTERPDWYLWYARKFEFCQWTMASIKGHPALRLVLDNIVTFYEMHTDEEIAVGPQGKPQTVNATGPGIWTDTLHEWFEQEHHLYFDENKTVPNETHYDPWRARNDFIRSENISIFPVRSFGMNSGGYQLRPEHSSSDIFVRHAYLGSWKRQVVPGMTSAPLTPPSTVASTPATKGVTHGQKRHQTDSVQLDHHTATHVVKKQRRRRRTTLAPKHKKHRKP